MSDVGESRILFDFPGERGLSIDEARILRDWLQRGGQTLAAVELRQRIEVEITAQVPAAIAVDGEDVAALRSVLCDTDVGGHDGLVWLKTAVCGPGVEARPDRRHRRFVERPDP